MSEQASDALLILKPDVLSGAYARCGPALARDVVRAMFTVYTGRACGPYEVETSEGAVDWGLQNIFRKARARAWYKVELRDAESCLLRLATFSRELRPDADGQIETARLVLGVAAALGFEITMHERRSFTYRDLLGLYADNTHFTRLAGDLRGYLLGRPIEIFLLRGEQELTSLHVFKELLRRVVRYPTTHYDALENMLHVADPGSDDFTYFNGIIS